MEIITNLEGSDVLLEELNPDCNYTWDWWAVILDGNRVTVVLLRGIRLGIAFVEKIKIGELILLVIV